MDKTGYTAYLEKKELTTVTINNHIELAERFFTKIKKEDVQVTKPDILKYLEYLKNNRRQQNSTRKLHLSALKHYFNHLYQEGMIAKNPCSLLKIRGVKRKTLYKIYTPDELEQLFDNYYHVFIRNFDNSRYNNERQRRYMALTGERNAAILSILVHQGVITTEIGKIETDDLDIIKASLKIRSTKKHNERTLPLKAAQIGVLMHYLQNIRPQFLEYQTTESNKLFLSLPALGKKTMDNDMAEGVFIKLSAQLKTIDKQFLNFLQVRAAIITSWLKVHGLRKTQYLAGHKHVTSTEEYISNNLDDLTDNINKLHPF
jgi:site-specific recombinase XerD